MGVAAVERGVRVEGSAGGYCDPHRSVGVACLAAALSGPEAGRTIRPCKWTGPGQSEACGCSCGCETRPWRESPSYWVHWALVYRVRVLARSERDDRVS